MIPLKFEETVFARQEDELSALILSPPQKQNVKNLIVKAVNEKVNMSAEEEGYLLKQEYGRGQLDILQFLLVSSEQAEAVLQSMQGFGPGNSAT